MTDRLKASFQGVRLAFDALEEVLQRETRYVIQGTEGNWWVVHNDKIRGLVCRTIRREYAERICRLLNQEEE